MKKKFLKDQKVMAQSRLFGSSSAKKESFKPPVENSFDSLKDLHCGTLASKLQTYEDEHLGNFSRIFPPENEDSLDSYLNLLNYLNSIPTSDKTETATTKARKEYLTKQSLQDLKTLKYQEWKKRGLSKTVSKPKGFSLDSILQNKRPVSDTTIRPRLSVSNANQTQRSGMELCVQNITYPSGA
jgi:hypothetical protein